jgi:uncharacterized protein (DUF362 family)
MNQSRRDFLKRSSLAGLPMILGVPLLRGESYAHRLALSPSTVQFVTGTDRRQNMINVLTPLSNAINTAIQNKNIIVKPNCVLSGVPLCATHADALRGVLDFLRTITDKPILIAESSASNNTLQCFSEYGYSALTTEYAGVSFQDLNSSATQSLGGIVDKNGTGGSINLISQFANPHNFIISVCRLKTHNTVVATATVKNILMASPALASKVIMHGGDYSTAGAQTLTKNLFFLANTVLPDLAVVDGAENMEGCGPIGMTADGCAALPVTQNLALAGFDPIAVDRVGIHLMGVNPNYTQYLKWCGDAQLGNYDMSNIVVNGPGLAPYVKTFRLHDNISGQIAWISSASARGEPRNTCAFMKVSEIASIPGRGARITVSIPRSNEVNLAVHNAKGDRICSLAHEWLQSGRYEFTWEGRDGYGNLLSNGIYAIVLRIEDASMYRLTRIVR